MNIYEKLAQARVDLQKRNLQKSGHNKFAGYDYFELRDFLPAINEIMAEHKLLGICRFDEKEATLEIIDAEDPKEGGRIRFHSPMSTAELKGCHPVQNLGAVQTYLRRYLYTAAFEIVEGDALDATQGKDDDPLGTGNVKHLPQRGEKCAVCGAVLNNAQTTLAKKYAPSYDGRLLCADCRAKEDLK